MKPVIITIHCSATKNGETCDIDVIRKWHVEDRGWKDVGYHAIIQPDGEIQNGRPLNEIGAHVKSYNIWDNGINVRGINVGICLIGTDKYSIDQFSALRYYIEGLNQLYGVGPANVYCHYELDHKKTCPNIRNVELVAWLITNNYETLKPYLIKED